MTIQDSFRKYIVSRRTFLLTTGKISILSLLLGRMFYLQILKGREYKVLSEKNRINLIMITPARGKILDNNNSIVTENRSGFFVKLDRKEAANYQESLEHFFELMNLNDEEKLKIFKNIKNSSSKTPVTLVKDIKWRYVARIEENLDKIPGIYTENLQLRIYNFPESCCHITGYLGRLSEHHLLDKNNIASEFQVGKAGLEKQYEEVLQGKFGYKKAEINAKGILVRELEKVKPSNGGDIKLTIDANLQEHIHSIMPQEGGSAVIMDVNNGDILGIYSAPTFNPNEFVGGVSHPYWQEITKDPLNPLINKAIQTHYPPGSTFKLITILAALEEGVSKNFKIFCSGKVKAGGRVFRCWKHSGHGLIDMHDAIKQSCNCYMYEIGRLIGAEKLLLVSKKLGFGEKTGIDLPGEVSGFLPSKEWKFKHFKFGWSIGDSLNIAIGQGALLSTPMQQARMAAFFANEGLLLSPKINSQKESIKNFPDINKNNIKIIKNAMYSAINEKGGTSYNSRSNKVNIAGKTGTSQVQSKKSFFDDLSKKTIIRKSRNHALFAGFWPYESPKYSISVIIDHGGGGASTAAPIAKRIIEFLS